MRNDINVPLSTPQRQSDSPLYILRNDSVLIKGMKTITRRIVNLYPLQDNCPWGVNQNKITNVRTVNQFEQKVTRIGFSDARIGPRFFHFENIVTVKGGRKILKIFGVHPN